MSGRFPSPRPTGVRFPSAYGQGGVVEHGSGLLDANTGHTVASTVVAKAMWPFRSGTSRRWRVGSQSTVGAERAPEETPAALPLADTCQQVAIHCAEMSGSP